MAGHNNRGGAQVGAPNRGREASSRAAAGRVCSALGCSTILSTYNSSETCGIHAEPTFRPLLPPKSR